MNTARRLQLLADCSALFAPFTGPFDAALLSDWVAAELGGANALDEPIPHGPIRSQARAAERILHVVSENTPHAAFQSLLRGLVVGSENLVKLPTAGLPELVDAVDALPSALARTVRLVRELPPEWHEWPQVLVVFGNDETIAWFAEHTPPTIRFLAHGQKLSIAIVGDDLPGAARLAAHDVSLFDQQGCLSVHDVYLSPGAGSSPPEFAVLLAGEMEKFNQRHPRATLSALEAGRISSFREEVRFSAAVEPDAIVLLQSESSTDWTVVCERDPVLKVSPLNRVVFVKPWPDSDPREALGPDLRHLSTIALHPFPPAVPDSLLTLGASRFCPLGDSQNPSLFWHHDGHPPLASLVSWIDIG